MKKELFKTLNRLVISTGRLAPRSARLAQIGPEKAWKIEAKPEPLTFRSGRTLEILISGNESEVVRYQLSFGPPGGWRICFHLDPKGEKWPEHPLHHIHLECPRDSTSELPCPPDDGAGPWVTEPWRIPSGETAPDRLVEYLLHLDE